MSLSTSGLYMQASYGSKFVLPDFDFKIHSNVTV